MGKKNMIAETDGTHASNARDKTTTKPKTQTPVKKGKDAFQMPTKVLKKVLTPTWTRTGKGGEKVKAVEREVDEAEITSLLDQRSKAKACKDYKKADDIAESLKKLDIIYNDELSKWFTRAISDGNQNTELESLDKDLKVGEKKKRECDVAPSTDVAKPKKKVTKVQKK